jgi:anti-sigma factor RsiW
MNHPEKETLLALFDGELSDIETARLERHIENCADCRERLAELEETSMALAGVIAELDAAEPDAWPTARTVAPNSVLGLDRLSAQAPPPFAPEPAGPRVCSCWRASARRRRSTHGHGSRRRLRQRRLHCAPHHRRRRSRTCSS